MDGCLSFVVITAAEKDVIRLVQEKVFRRFIANALIGTLSLVVTKSLTVVSSQIGPPDLPVIRTIVLDAGNFDEDMPFEERFLAKLNQMKNERN